MHDDYDEGEHIKEVFAYFGSAYYMANVFETGLALAVLVLDFLTEVTETAKRQGMKGFDRARYEAEFDAFMKRQHAKSSGI